MHQSVRLPEAWNGCPRYRGIDAHLPWNTHLCSLELPNSHCKAGLKEILAHQAQGGSHGL
jgi:hypothetical protein